MPFVALLLICSEVFTATNSQSLFEQGMKAFESGNYGSSELLFRKIIDNGDDEYREKSWFYLALSIFNQKKYKSAIFEFNRLLLICTSSDLCSESRYWIAESYFKLKKYINAIEEFKRFISTSKNKQMVLAAHVRIGDIYFIQSRYDEAIIEWNKAREKNGEVQKDGGLLLKIGEAHFLNEDYDKVLTLFEPLVHSEKEITITSSARLLIGRVYQIKGNHRKALQAFIKIPGALSREAPYYDVKYFKAISLLQLGDMASARSQLESFILIGERSEWFYHAQYELGKILIRFGDEKRGIELLEEVRTSTSRMDLRSQSALVLSKIFLKRNPEEAIPYLEDSVSLNDPAEQKEVLLLLGNAYIEVKRFEDAERILELVLDTYPYDNDIDEVQFLISRVYLERGDIEKAIAGFEKIKDMNPFSDYTNESYFFLAVAYHKKNRKEAKSSLEKYLALPKSKRRYEAYLLLLEIYSSKGDIREAEKVVRILLNNYSSKEGFAEVLYDFAMSLEDERRERYLKIIVSQYSHSVSAGKILLLWGDVAFKAKDYRNAELYYTRYLQNGKRSKAGSVFLYRIISLYMQEKYKEVISLLAEEKKPEMSSYTAKQLVIWKGRSYYQLGYHEKTYNTFLGLELNDLPLSDIVLLSRCSLQLGDITTARMTAEMLQDDKNLYAEALYYLGEHYLQKNDFDTAKTYLLDVILKCPDSEFVDNAKTSMAELHIKRGSYRDAIQKLMQIKKPDLEDRKNALLIVSYFKTGRWKEAVELTERNLKRLIDSPYGELAFKETLYYYYQEADRKNFKRYSRYLLKYSGNGNYVNFLSGMLYLRLGSYNSAYYFLYRTGQTDSEYRDEALYYLGMISYLQHKNMRLAKNHFNKLIQAGTDNNEFSLRAKIALSIMYKEEGEVELSKRYLSEIINSTDNKLLFIQAKNLFESFGY